jgi:outer membrane protein assembly factor BamD
MWWILPLLASEPAQAQGIQLNIGQGKTIGGPRKPLTVEEQYELGMKYLKRGYYVKALEQFNRIRNYHRDDPYAVKAELAIADLYYKKSEWDQARLAYEDFLRLHPRHESADYVVYRLGMTSWKKSPKIASRDQTWTRQAVDTWARFEVRYAESEYIDEVNENLGAARDRLARKEYLIGTFYAEQRKAWPAVVGRMQELLRAYPDSKDAPMARAWLAIAHKELDQLDAAQQVASKVIEDDDSGAMRLLRRKAPELIGD